MRESIGKAGIVDPNKGKPGEFQNQSSIFKSNVERMEYLEPKMKTFISGKLAKSRPSAKNLEAAKSDVMMIPEISPGPGDYLNNDHLTTFKGKKKPNHLQFFNSTEERVAFVDKLKQKNDINQEFRGPGLYENNTVNNIVKEDKHHKGYSSSFISGRDK